MGALGPGRARLLTRPSQSRDSEWLTYAIGGLDFERVLRRRVPVRTLTMRDQTGRSPPYPHASTAAAPLDDGPATSSRAVEQIERICRPIINEDLA
jgi:hypothetical protein